MKLFTQAQYAQLLANGRKQQEAMAKNEEFDPMPVIKLFTPDAAATWLLSEIDPEDPDIAFGLCDLGLGFPELGRVSLTEIRAVRGRLKLPVERDLGFIPDKTLSAYAEEARQHRQIIA
jgi:hypothetical protein